MATGLFSLSTDFVILAAVCSPHRWDLFPGAPSFSLPHPPFPSNTVDAFGVSPRALSVSDGHLPVHGCTGRVADPLRVSTVYESRQLCF